MEDDGPSSRSLYEVFSTGFRKPQHINPINLEWDCKNALLKIKCIVKFFAHVCSQGRHTSQNFLGGGGTIRTGGLRAPSVWMGMTPLVSAHQSLVDLTSLDWTQGHAKPNGSPVKTSVTVKTTTTIRMDEMAAAFICTCMHVNEKRKTGVWGVYMFGSIRFTKTVKGEFPQ